MNDVQYTLNSITFVLLHFPMVQYKGYILCTAEATSSYVADMPPIERIWNS